MSVVNRETGQQITAQEQEQIDALAKSILSNPYSAPERAAWAIDCASPAVVEEWFFQQWESCRQRGIRQRREQDRLLAEQSRYEYNRRQNKIAAHILDNGLPPDWAEVHEIEDAGRLLPSEFEYGPTTKEDILR